MTKTVVSTYSINFTDQSLRDLKEELEARIKIREEMVNRINSNLRLLGKIIENTDIPARTALQELFMDIHVLDQEAYYRGRGEMYRYIANNIPPLMSKFIFRLFKDLKIRPSRNRIREAVDWAIFYTILEGIKLSKEQKVLAKEYDIDPADFTRVKNRPVIKRYRAALKSLNKQIQMQSITNQISDIDIPSHYALEIEEKSNGAESVDTLRLTSVKERRDSILAESAADWAIAEKIYKKDGIEKSLLYLRISCFSEGSINKFKKQMRLPGGN